LTKFPFKNIQDSDSVQQQNKPLTDLPSIKKMAKPKRQPISVKRIAEIGVVTAAVVVVFLATAWFIDALIPYIGCVIRTITVAVFITGLRHYTTWELFLINTMASIFYFLLIPCPINAIAIPIAMSFIIIYNSLRRYLQPWLVVTLASIAAYGAMIASLAVWDMSSFYNNFMTALKLTIFLVPVIPLLAWWRQKRSTQVACTGCTQKCDMEVFKQL